MSDLVVGITNYCTNIGFKFETVGYQRRKLSYQRHYFYVDSVADNSHYHTSLLVTDKTPVMFELPAVGGYRHHSLMYRREELTPDGTVCVEEVG